MSKPQILCGIDIGTTKVACAIGMRDAFGEPWIVGASHVASRSVPKGVVTDLAWTTQTVTKALEEAEEQAQVKVDRALVNLSGAHLAGIHSRGTVELDDPEGEITRRDLDRVIAQAKTITVSYDRQVVHAIPQLFIVDGVDGVKSPVGMFGHRLEAELFIVTGLAGMIQNVRKSVEGAGLEVSEIVSSGIATAHAVLTEQERELGTVLIDIGGSVSEIVWFLDGVVRGLAVLPMGGDRLTEALQSKLRVPGPVAEELKLRYGAASCRDMDLQAKALMKVEGVSKSFSRSEICAILEESWRELVRPVVDRVEAHPLVSKMSSGVVLTGRTLMLEGAIEAAEPLFQMPVRMGITRGLRSAHAEIYHPAYATAIGLIRYAIDHHEARLPLTARRGVLGLVDRVQSLLREYF